MGSLASPSSQDGRPGGHIPPNPLDTFGHASSASPHFAAGAAGSPQDSGLPAASASSARPHSGGPSASLGATSAPADTLSPRRLWPLAAISAAYRRASAGAGAVPSFAHRGLSSAHARLRAVRSHARLRCAPQWLGEASPNPSRPRPDALIARPTARNSPQKPGGHSVRPNAGPRSSAPSGNRLN